MADYITQFSCLLDVLTPENAAKALELYASGEWGQADRGPYCEGFARTIAEELGGNWLRITDGGTGDVEVLIDFVKHCAGAFGLLGLWGFQYADTCSRPRPGGFGGGAHVLDLATGESVDWINTGDWLSALIAAGADHA